MDLGTFKMHFPEFRETDPQLIVAKLQAAAARMGGPDSSVWGSFAASGQNPTLADIAQGNLAAHYLIKSPFGTEMRKADDDSSGSSYFDVFEELQEAVAGGGIVAGGPTLSIAGGGAPPPALVFITGGGTASVANGSTAVTFAAPQTLQAGTLLAFASQPGAYYSVALSIVGQTSATIAAPYNGTTNAATAWTHT